MPHITIEYSSNIAAHHDVQELVDRVHAAAIAHGLAPEDALRTRAAAREHYRIADGAPDNAFVAIHVRVGPGRGAEEKQSFLVAVLDAAEAAISAGHPALAIAWSIELTEIDPTFRINRNRIRERMRSTREHD